MRVRAQLRPRPGSSTCAPPPSGYAPPHSCLQRRRRALASDGGSLPACPAPHSGTPWRGPAHPQLRAGSPDQAPGRLPSCPEGPSWPGGRAQAQPRAPLHRRSPLAARLQAARRAWRQHAAPERAPLGQACRARFARPALRLRAARPHPGCALAAIALRSMPCCCPLPRHRAPPPVESSRAAPERPAPRGRRGCTCPGGATYVSRNDTHGQPASCWFWKGTGCWVRVRRWRWCATPRSLVGWAA